MYSLSCEHHAWPMSFTKVSKNHSFATGCCTVPLVLHGVMMACYVVLRDTRKTQKAQGTVWLQLLNFKNSFSYFTSFASLLCHTRKSPQMPVKKEKLEQLIKKLFLDTKNPSTTLTVKIGKFLASELLPSRHLIHLSFILSFP